MFTIAISSDPSYLGVLATSSDVEALAARVAELLPNADVRVRCNIRVYTIEDRDRDVDVHGLIEQAYEEFGF